MRRVLGCTLLVFGLLPGVMHAQASACRAADSTSALFVRELTRIATGTDVSSQRMREVGRIPQVSANQVSFVTNKTVCSKALPVFNANSQVKSASTGQTISTPSTQVYVVQVGSVYAVMDRGKQFGEYTTMVVMDKTYHLLANTGL
jgi:hypothetical protein